MQPITITSPSLPHPPNVYSQGVRLGNLLFVSGQAGIDFTTGNISNDFETQARQAFENVATVLKAAGSHMGKVAKTTIWLCNAANFDILNKLYSEFFPINPPARSTPIVSLPKDIFQISIEAIACVD